MFIEGPASFTPLIPLLLHRDAKAPFAIYTSFAEAAATAEPLADARTRSLPPSRRAAYYPFCDYSPELVALRVGQSLGAKLRFIDLDYPAQVRAEQAAEQAFDATRVESLLSEQHLARSRYLQALARRAGCRDHNDLWDHCFETRLADPADGHRFIRDVAAWCYYARMEATEDSLRADGTLAREAAMAVAIRKELARGVKSLVVVTGGFHTVALPALVHAKQLPRLPRDERPPAETLACLVRYSFEQLDALNGYAAGMPSPFYYDQLWQAAQAGEAEPFAGLAARMLVELSQLTRRKKMAVALSPADAIAALQQARRLAQLRGHPGPTREDLLDGIRSCFVKGALDAEGTIVLGLAQHALGGTRIGEVPAAAGSPPLVNDFRARAKRLRLKLGDSIRRKLSLDLYRQAPHREASRFLHSLALLEVPFATLVAGPDFVRGTGLERLHEHWDYQWFPQTESQLVEAGVFGATVEEAATNRLLHAIAGLEANGRGRSAGEAVGLLVQACRLGLHRHAGRLVTLIAQQVAEDPAFASLTGALSQLMLLWESREPLEAHRLVEIPRLARAAFERACYLLHQLAGTPEDAADETLAALAHLRELLASSLAAEDALDTGLFWEPLARLAEQSHGPALLLGGVNGLLAANDRLPEAELLRRVAGALDAATVEASGRIGFLIGLLRTCRELAWRQPALADAVDRLLAAWSDEDFIAKLPHLRLAFASLTPRETDQVARVVAQLQGGEPLGLLPPRGDVSEGDLLAALRLDAAAKQALRDDGLGAWLELPAPVREVAP